MSRVRRIAASAATVLLLCASSSHATSEHPFDESAVTCDGGCVFEYGDDGSVSLSAVGDWVEVTQDITVDGDLSISAATIIVSARISSTDSLTINAAESVAFNAGSSIYSRSSLPGGIRSSGAIGLEGSLVVLSDTLGGVSETGGLIEGAVFVSRMIDAPPPRKVESVNPYAGGSLTMNVIPEPSTALLLGTGVALLGFARRN